MNTSITLFSKQNKTKQNKTNKINMKYVISEATTGDIIKVYSDIEDSIGGEYFYFKHLVDTQKKNYKDGNRVYAVIEDDDSLHTI